MKYTKLLLAILAVMFCLPGCGLDNYGDVPKKTERVPMMRPYYVFFPKAGVEIPAKPFQTGARNHGNGPCAAYDFDMSVHSQNISVNVLVADKINVPATFSASYRMIPGQTPMAAANFMPTDKMPSLETSASIQVIKVPVGEIFNRNVLPYFDEVIRDVMDEYKSVDINPSLLGAMALERLNSRLAKHKTPAMEIKNGKAVFDPNRKICITDVMEIIRISPQGYVNPDFIQDRIEKIDEKKAEVKGLREGLKQWKIKRKMREKQALHAKQEANNIRDTLKANPHMFGLLRKKNLEELLAGAHPGTNTTVLFYPAEMNGQIIVQMPDMSDRVGPTRAVATKPHGL